MAIIQPFSDLGLIPPENIITDSSKIQRIGTLTKPKSKNGWYRASKFNGHTYVLAGNWETDQQARGSTNGDSCSPEVKQFFVNSKKEAETERAEANKVAAEKAVKLLPTLQPLKTHPYLAKKNIEPCGDVLISKNGKEIIIPVYNLGELAGYQRIFENGGKYPLEGTKMGGGYFIIPGNDSTTYIVEGYATACTVHMATGNQVVVAFFAGNLPTVSKQLSGNIVVCGDYDKPSDPFPFDGGAGLHYAKLTGLPYRMPPETGTDFNDIGTDATREILRIYHEQKTPWNYGDLAAYLEEHDFSDCPLTQKTDLVADITNNTDQRDRAAWDLARKLIKKKLGFNMKTIDGMILDKEIEACLEEYEPSGALTSALDELNKNHATIMAGGLFRILEEYTDHVFDQPEVRFMKKQDFIDRHGNNKFFTPYGEKSLGELWLGNKNRREYDHIVFDPNRTCSNRCYNLFRGLPIEPKEGDWSLMALHMLEVICAGNEKHYQYLEMLIARIIQDPGGIRPGVAPILRGMKGTGKGVFMSWLETMFGRYYSRVDSSDRVTGRFNAMCSQAIVLFADEAFFVGDKAMEGKLKGMITEETNVLEKKFLDPVTIKNHINLFMASNNDFIVPATKGERRFFVLDVSDHRRKDFKYFGEVEKQRDNGGVAAMMYDLLRIKVDMNLLRKPPATDALKDQVISNLDSVERFWRHCLSRGYILSNGENRWEERVHLEKGVIYDEYGSFCHQSKLRYIENFETFFRMTYGKDGVFKNHTNRLTKRRNDGKRFFCPLPLDEMEKLFDDTIKV